MSGQFVMPERGLMQYLTESERQSLFSKTEEKEYKVCDLQNALRSLGIEKGNTVCVHSQIYSLGIAGMPRNEYLNMILKVFKDAVGKDGTIIMPTFSYSFCDNQVFDLQNSKSAVGILTEFFRNSEGVSRTLHPIFSFSVWGKRREEFMKNSTDAFSMDSVYGKMIKSNDKMVMLGADKGYTIYYLAEEKVGVSHRFFKNFSGIVRDGEKEYELTVPYYVRHLDKRSEENPQSVSSYLLEKGIEKKVPFGWGSISSFLCKPMFESIVNKLKEDETFFLK